MKGRLPLLLLPLLLIVFALGVARLFQLRLEQGDVYPAYSTLRADPLGAKVYFESLGQLQEVEVTRLYEDTDKFGDGRDATLFVLGTNPDSLRHMPDNEIEDIEKFMKQGGRVVVSLFPTPVRSYSSLRTERREKEDADKSEKEKPKQPKRKPAPANPKEDAKKLEPGDKSPSAKPTDAKKKDPLDKKSARRKGTRPGRDEDDERMMKRTSLYEHWGVNLEYKDLSKDEKGVAEPVTVTRSGGAPTLPATLSWHTAVMFTELAKEWRTNYARDGKAVLIERPVGKGSLVLSADSYFVSNEAMRRDRHAPLLAWLAGANHRLIFDETHLGVQSDPGIAALARKYRLHGLAVGLFVLTLFFVWKNSTSFVPPHDDESFAGREHAVAGRDSASAFVNLLRRSIPPRDLLTTCFEEWRKSCARTRPGLDARMKRMQAVLVEQVKKPAKERDAVGSYRELGRILAEKK